MHRPARDRPDQRRRTATRDRAERPLDGVRSYPGLAAAVPRQQRPERQAYAARQAQWDRATDRRHRHGVADMTPCRWAPPIRLPQSPEGAAYIAAVAANIELAAAADRVPE